MHTVALDLLEHEIVIMENFQFKTNPLKNWVERVSVINSFGEETPIKITCDL